MAPAPLARGPLPADAFPLIRGTRARVAGAFPLRPWDEDPDDPQTAGWMVLLDLPAWLTALVAPGHPRLTREGRRPIVTFGP